MAGNVFGSPITDETLKATPKYGSRNAITRLDRAREAFNVKNWEDKDAHALKYAEKLRAEYGNGVSTLCVFYNATGDKLTFVSSVEWEGHIWKSPYPKEVANGQWGAFLHVHTSGKPLGSVAAVVYRGKTADGNDSDWMFAWSNPRHVVYAECHKVGHYSPQKTGLWNDLLNIMHKPNRPNTQNGESDGRCVTELSITERAPVVFEAILTLRDADQPDN